MATIVLIKKFDIQTINHVGGVSRLKTQIIGALIMRQDPDGTTEEELLKTYEVRREGLPSF